MTGVNARTILLAPQEIWSVQAQCPVLAPCPPPLSFGGTTPASVSPSGATVRFDARGAVSTGNVIAFYLNSRVAPEAGYRAVLLMPAGSIQIWSGDSTGAWWQMR